MSVLEAFILGLVQGLTEFIPVSSSGHLVLLHELFDTSKGGLTFDVALHIGTLAALVLYFYKDITLLIKGIFGKNEYMRTAWLLALATIPAVVFGMLFKDSVETVFRSTVSAAINLIVFALIMLAAEWYAKRHSHMTSELQMTTLRQALAIGAAQALAIIPGVSRSGSTITAGLFAGLDRVTATRFSFLLGIPIMLGAVVNVLSEDQAMQAVGGDLVLFVVGVVAALLSGMFAIRFLLKFLSRHSLAVFAYYRIALGTIVLLLSA